MRADGDVVADPVERLAAHHAHAVDLGDRFDQAPLRRGRSLRQVDDEHARVDIRRRDAQPEAADLGAALAGFARCEELDGQRVGEQFRPRQRRRIGIGDRDPASSGGR